VCLNQIPHCNMDTSRPTRSFNVNAGNYGELCCLTFGFFCTTGSGLLVVMAPFVSVFAVFTALTGRLCFCRRG